MKICYFFFLFITSWSMAVADFSFWRLFSLSEVVSFSQCTPRGQAPHPLLRKTWSSNQCVGAPWERFALPFCFTQGHRLLIQCAPTSDSQPLDCVIDYRIRVQVAGDVHVTVNQHTDECHEVSALVSSPQRGFPRPLCLKWALFVPNLSLPHSTVPIPTWHLPFPLLSVFFTVCAVLSHLAVSGSLQPRGLQPSRLLSMEFSR